MTASPLRILQVNSASEMGGGETHLLTLIGGLIARGHHISLTVRPNSPLIERVNGLPIRLSIAPLRNSVDLQSVYRLRKTILADQIDIVHCHHARDFLVGALAVRAAGRANLVLTRHLLYPMKNSLAYRRALAPARRVIAVSEAVRQSVLRAGMFAPGQVVTVYNGIDIDRYSQPVERSGLATLRSRYDLTGSFIIGVIGQLAPHKGQEVFFRAAALLKDDLPTAQFVLVGRDQSPTQEFRRRLDQLAQDLGISDRVRLVGFVDDVPAILGALDLLVLPSLAEPFGLVLIEAMASGTPVIATASGGPLEIVETEKTGLLTASGNQKELAAAILRVYRDEALRTELIRNAANAARSRFSSQRMVEETERVYMEANSQND